VNGSFVEPIDPSTRIEFAGDLILEPQEELGLWLEYERRFGARIGLDVALLQSGHDVDGTVKGTLMLVDNMTDDVLEMTQVSETEKIGEIDFTPLFVGVNFHLTPARPLDVYLGPFLAWVTYGDLEFDDESISIDDDFAIGAVAGVDVPFGRGRWCFSGALRYLGTEADPGSGPDDHPLDVNPWIVHAGVGYRF
jgi:outer membrane protein W